MSHEPGRPARPKLVAVPGGEGGARSEGAAGEPGGARWPWLPLLLGVALALCAVAFASQARRAAALETQLADVQGRLARAEAQLSAWDAWRSDVRGHAERVGRDLRELDAALARGPAEAAPAK